MKLPATAPTSARTGSGQLTAWALVIGLLATANLVWMGWNRIQNQRDRVAGGRFLVETVRTNGVNGVVIVERATRQPIWSDFWFPGKPGQGSNEMFSFWFEGRDAMDINLGAGRQARRGVMFYGPDGRLTTLWADRGGNGTFDEKITYGDQEREEVWYNDAWHTVIKRDGKRGLLLNAKWCELARAAEAWTAVQPATSK